jgi:hypothetical protein
MVEARCGETVVGHLIMVYATRENSYATTPDGLHFMDQHRGWCLNFDDPKDLWCGAHLYYGRTPLSLRSLDNPAAPYHLSRDDAPEADILEADLAEIHEIGERQRRSWLKGLSIPLVASARVDGGEKSGTNWRRQGIAKAMYRLAAQELGARGMVLMASSLQSDDAKALWARFESDPQMPTRRMKVPVSSKPGETRLGLDYRK